MAQSRGKHKNYLSDSPTKYKNRHQPTAKEREEERSGIYNRAYRKELERTL